MSQSVGEIQVEVAYALPERQLIVRVVLPSSATVGAAIERSGICERFQGLTVDDRHVGIFGRACRLTTTLSDGDRVEIYRDLLADPKEVRRQRAAGAG